MGISGCVNCIKYLMFVFMFIFWLLGCAILGVGIWIRVDPDSNMYVDPNKQFNWLYVVTYVLMGVGSIIMAIGFFGCCGAIRESQCMLASFSVLLFFIFGVLVAAGAGIIIYQKELNEAIEAKMKQSVDKYDKETTEKEFADMIQSRLSCCGVLLGKADYGGRTVPPSCGDSNEPCLTKLTEKASSYRYIIAGVALGIALLMLLGVIFSIVLCCAIRATEAECQ